MITQRNKEWGIKIRQKLGRPPWEVVYRRDMLVHLLHRLCVSSPQLQLSSLTGIIHTRRSCIPVLVISIAKISARIRSQRPLFTKNKGRFVFLHFVWCFLERRVIHNVIANNTGIGVRRIGHDIPRQNIDSVNCFHGSELRPPGVGTAAEARATCLEILSASWYRLVVTYLDIVTEAIIVICCCCPAHWV